MATRYFALIYGIVFLLVGIAGFVPGLRTPLDMDVHLAIDGTSGRLFGLFPINSLDNLVHLAFGVCGIIAYRTFPASRLYARSVAIIYAVLTIMGLIPGLKITFGLVPLYSPTTSGCTRCSPSSRPISGSLARSRSTPTRPSLSGADAQERRPAMLAGRLAA